MTTFKSGVLPNNPAKPRLRLTSFLTGAPVTALPATVNWDRVVKAWGMLGNDGAGDCVFAMIGHTIVTWTANAGTELDPSTADALKAYTEVTGYNPADPSTDNGTVMQDAFDYWRKTGFPVGTARHKIVAFAQVDHTNVTEMETAVALFGELLLAIGFPASAMDQFNNGQPWDVVPGSKNEGGHAICSARYDSTDPHTPWVIITWGREQKVTAAFLATYLSEAWVAIGPEWIAANGTTPSGLDLFALGHQFVALTGQPNPFPPQPPVPPVPPTPPHTFPDAVFAAVLHADGWLTQHHVGDNAKVASAARAWLASKGL